MFKDAYEIASHFTLPVVMSRQTVKGDCSSGIGTATLLNDEGWFLTAHHILAQWQVIQNEAAATKQHEASAAAINNDPNLTRDQKKQRLRQLGHLNPNATRHCSIWFGRDNVNLAEGGGVPGIDLGIGRLHPWQPEWASTYATIKDPTKDYKPGASLCKIGFPFHQITPAYDAVTQAFRLPPGAIPLPRFPIDGILTRFVEVVVTDQNGQPIQPPYPMWLIETSSPGLRGQSGGPTVDSKGTVWAIQSQTVSYALNLEGNSKMTPKAKEHLEHQFFNVGQGIHSATIIGLLNERGVKFQLSAY